MMCNDMLFKLHEIERKKVSVEKDTIERIPSQSLPRGICPLPLHFAPAQLSRKIGYHCPGEPGISREE